MKKTTLFIMIISTALAQEKISIHVGTAMMNIYLDTPVMHIKVEYNKETIYSTYTYPRSNTMNIVHRLSL